MESSVSAEDRLNVWQLCKTYLGGEWSDVCADDLVIKYAANGYVNKTLYCSLANSNNPQTKYPKVVVKYQNVDYLKSSGINLTYLSAVNIILSENNIAPKVLAVFEKGNICEFIDSRYFSAADDLNPTAVAVLAQKVAKLHSIDMPIPKDNTESHLKLNLEIWFSESDRESYKHGLVREEIQKNNYKTFMSVDLLEEIDWIQRVCKQVDSPVVFSHNDLMRRNILVRDAIADQPLDVYLIDLDWSSYMFRGADFGDYFINWCQTELDFGDKPFPTDDQMLVFIDAYIREMTAINGNSFTQLEINSRDKLIKEAKVLGLFSYMKMITWTNSITNKSGTSEMMPKGEQTFKNYKLLKDRLIEDYPEFE